MPCQQSWKRWAQRDKSEQHMAKTHAQHASLSLAKAAACLPLLLMLGGCVEGNAQATDEKPATIIASLTLDLNGDRLDDRVDLVYRGEAEVDVQIVFGNKDDQPGELTTAIVKKGIAFHGNMAAQNATLEPGRTGGFLIKSLNEGIGRGRWEKTLAVAFRKGEFVVAGLSYMERDTLDHNAGGTCDVNFLTGKAIRNDRSFAGRNELIALKDWDPDFLPKACEF
jgi:hypothetical protein